MELKLSCYIESLEVVCLKEDDFLVKIEVKFFTTL